MAKKLPALKRGHVWIKGYEGKYSISKSGKIWSYLRTVPTALHGKGKKEVGGHYLKPFAPKHEYVKVALHDGGRANHKSIHRLLAEHFLSNPKNKEQVNHKNGVKDDNRLSNLEWVTPKEQIQHAWKIGLSKCTPAMREKAPQNGKKTRKLSKLQVSQFRRLHEAYHQQVAYLAKEFGISLSTAYRIVNKRAYKDIK